MRKKLLSSLAAASLALCTLLPANVHAANGQADNWNTFKIELECTDDAGGWNRSTIPVDLIDSAGLTSDITIAMLCYSVILAPIGEELIFRGVTMRLARRALPFWLANIFQALMFGIFHMNWIQGIYAFALGLLLGYVCEKGGSIYYSLLMHILFNFWGTVLEQLLGNFGSTIFTALLMLLIMIVSLTLGLVLFSVGGKNKAARIKAKQFASIPTAQ